jgi:signal peptidase I
MAAGRPSRRSRLLTGLLVAGGVGVLALGIAIRIEGLRFQTVLSGSMRPTLSPGDVAVTHPVPVGTLRVGDVIVFVPPGQDEPVIHRIASLGDGVITTQGDANTVADAWQVKLAGTTAYRLVGVVPLVGWLTELQRPAFLLAAVLVALVILDELRKEVRARRTRSLPEPQP